MASGSTAMLRGLHKPRTSRLYVFRPARSILGPLDRGPELAGGGASPQRINAAAEHRRVRGSDARPRGHQRPAISPNGLTEYSAGIARIIPP